ncbi:MAG: hypothetical protein WDW36_007083 [Sanguina aurantia]
MRKPPIIHARRDIESSHFLRAEQLDLEFSNGEHRTYERLKSSGLGAVIIVPMLDDDTGRLDQDETAEQGADRELKEEVGYGARKLTILHNLSLSPSYMTHMAHVVLAQDLYPERLVGDEPEEMEVVPWKMAELHTLVSRDDVTEGRSIAALFMAREYLAGRFKRG